MMAEKEYIERKALRNALYEADAITMEGVKTLNQFPAADVVPRSEWVSVDVQLPKEDIRVLVYVDSKRSYTKMDTDRMMNGKWVRWGTDVTHWMPLPEPPEVKE